MMGRNSLLIGLAVTLLLVPAMTAFAEVPRLIDEIRWSGIHEQAALEADLSQRRTLVIPALPSAPALDGSLDDEAWSHAALADAWMVNTGEGPAPVQTAAWLGIHRDHLYVGVRAEEPNVEGIVARVTEDGGPVWNDDCIEMFIDGNLDLRSARQFVINSIGTVATLSRGEDWRPEVARAAVVGEDAWSVEFALPISSLGLTGSEFGLNLCRERRAGGDLHLSAWSPTGGGFLEPARFGLASLPGGYLRGFVAGSAMLGHNELALTVANPDDRERRLSAELTWWQGDGIALQRRLGPLTLAPGATREVTFGYDIQSIADPVELEVAVLDESGRALARRQATQQVAGVLEMELSSRVLRGGERRIALRGVISLQARMLERTTLVLALFDQRMRLLAREERAPMDRIMRATVELPELAPGSYSLHLVLKHGSGASERRIAEEKAELVVLPPAGGR